MRKVVPRSSLFIYVYLLIVFGSAFATRSKVLVAASLQNEYSRQYAANWESEIFLAAFSCTREIALQEPLLSQAPLLQNSKHYSRLWGALARNASMVNDCARALEYWRKAAEANRWDEISRIQYAIAGFESGLLEDWTESFPDEDVARFSSAVGYHLVEAGDLLRSARWYELSLEKEPTRKTVDKLLNIYTQTDNAARKESLWAEYASYLPIYSTEYWWAIGKGAEMRGDWVGAAEAFEAGAELSESPYEFQLELGDAFLNLDLMEAEKAYLQASEQRPNQIWPILGLGHVEINRGNMEAARNYYALAEQMLPQDVNPKYFLGFLAFHNADYEAACGHFKNALEVDSTHQWSAYFIAQCTAEIKGIAAAIPLLETAIDMSSDAPLAWVLQLGDWQLASGEPGSARATYYTALDMYGESEAIRSRLSKLQEE